MKSVNETKIRDENVMNCAEISEPEVSRKYQIRAGNEADNVGNQSKRLEMSRKRGQKCEGCRPTSHKNSPPTVD
jgi:hypothetical protein